MPKITIFGIFSNVQMLIKTALCGKKVGTDHLGNTYYYAKPRKGTARDRRWVIYNGTPEASLVPPEWHGWLHHQTNAVPAENNPLRKPWQQPHQSNMTGTDQAYLPPGHVLRGGNRAASTSDYTAWQPPQ